jgi:hypothetical protein
MAAGGRYVVVGSRAAPCGRAPPARASAQESVDWIFTEREAADAPRTLADAPAPPFAGLPASLDTDSPGSPCTVSERPFAERPVCTMMLRRLDLLVLAIDRA